MKLPPFAYRRADTVEEALALLSEHGADAKLVAGGQSLLPLMSFRMVSPGYLVDVSGLRELAYVHDDPISLRVGAATPHAALEAARLGGGWEAFGDALPLIGHLPIRTRGTAGGSLAHADATAELPLLATTFNADLVVRSAAGAREVPAHAFFKGHLTTDLQPSEMVVEVRFPTPPAGAVSAFEEFAERAGDFAIASACTVVAVDQAGVCTFCRVGLGAVGPRPLRSPSAEAMLLGSRLDDDTIRTAGEAVLEDCSPRAGLHVSAEFRRELIVTMVRRSLRRAARRLAAEAV